MNRNRLITALVVTLATGASFHSLAAEDNAPKTRAQVLAEIEPARADGSFYAAGDGTPRGLARARLADRESRERQARAAADAQAAGAAQRSGS